MLFLQPYINWSYTPVDPLKSRQQTHTVPLPFAGPIDQVSNKICSEFASTNVSFDSQLRCTTLLSQSIRSLRIRYVSTARLQIPRLQCYDYYDKCTDFQQDGYVFMMTYVYDDDSMMNNTSFALSKPVWNENMMHDINASSTHADHPNCPVETTKMHPQSGHDNVEYVVQANASVFTPQPSLMLIRPHVCIFGSFSLHLATLVYLMQYNVHWIFPSREEEEEFELGLEFTFTSVTGFYPVIYTLTSTSTHSVTYLLTHLLSHMPPPGYDSNTVSLLELLRLSRQRHHRNHNYNHNHSPNPNDSHSSTHSHSHHDHYEDDRCDVWHLRGPSAPHHFAHLFHSDSKALRHKAQVIYPVNTSYTIHFHDTPC